MTEAPLDADIQKILFHEGTILARLDELAAEIGRDLAGREVTVVAILHGGLIFAADLLRRIHLPVKVETLSVASYHGGMRSTGSVTFNQMALPDLAGRHVLILDDILDSGRTLAAIRRRLESDCHAASVRSCVLLDKNAPRAEDVTVDYRGFEVGDEFVVGYGLDYRGRYRNLPYVGVLKPEAIERRESGPSVAAGAA